MERMKTQHRVVAVYLVVASAWIYGSDTLAASLVQSPDLLNLVQHVKGAAFVLLTALLLYTLVRRDVTALEQATRSVTDSYDHTIRGWIELMDLRHHETRDHIERVARMTVALARLAGYSGEALQRIERGAILHDVGKVGISDAILLKPGKLDEAEWAQMKEHPTVAYRLMSEIEFLRDCTDIPYCHHERWDGTGYPRGLKGPAIPLPARLFAVIDVFDALRSPRVYKPAWPEHEVVAYLRRESGHHLDPDAVTLFLANLREMKTVLAAPRPVAEAACAAAAPGFHVASAIAAAPGSSRLA